LKTKVKNIDKVRRIQDTLSNYIRQYKDYRDFTLYELSEVLNPEEFTGVMVVPNRIINAFFPIFLQKSKRG